MGAATANNSGRAEPKAAGRQRDAQYPVPAPDQNGGAFDGPLLSDQGVGQRRAPARSGGRVGKRSAHRVVAETSGSYAVVTEWKADVDVSTGAPVIKKEGVQHEKK